MSLSSELIKGQTCIRDFRKNSQRDDPRLSQEQSVTIHQATSTLISPSIV